MSIWDKKFSEFRDELSSSSPTPGGGAAAMAAAALGAGLFSMAAEISAKRAGASPLLGEFGKRARVMVSELSDLADRDADSYGEYLRARNIPKGDAGREEAVQKALLGSARVPLAGARTISKAIGLGRDLRPIVSESILSDMVAGEALLRGAFRAVIAVFESNLPYIKDEELKKELQKEREELISSLTEA